MQDSQIIRTEYSDVMKKSYIDYAMSVIIARALPDVRDGLKPVQRRTLYDMHELGIRYDKPYRKCARIVGDTMGKYHPHGDSSIYDALVVMAQEFKKGMILVDGHGNFGSIEGDGAAAMRYTEARLAKITQEAYLADLDKDIVDFMPNFDETEKEPVVLPVRIPNLLVNGAEGIAVGMATSIPTHNLGEVVDGVKAYMKNEEIDLGIKPLAAGLKSWEPMLKNSMAFVTAEYLSTDEGKDFGEKYRNGKTTLEGNWNKYLEKWSEMITDGVYTKDMVGIDHDQALEEFATGKAAMFCSGPWDLDTIKDKNPDLKVDMMPFYGTKASDGWLIGGPGCGFAVNKSSKNKDAAMKVLKALSTEEGQKAFWEDNQGGSSYLEGAKFELPEEYASASKALEAGNVYCPWNEWGDAASAHETYGTEMQSYLLGEQDLDTTLKNVDSAVKELLEK